MSISAIGSTFGLVPPSRAARETADMVERVVENQVTTSAAERLKTETASIAGGATLSNSSGLDRIAARIADGSIAVQEGGQAPSPPKSAARSYVMVAGAGG